MAIQKSAVLVLFGGRSPEHEISLLSASAVISRLNRETFSVRAAGIDRQGVFRLHPGEDVSPAALKKTAAGETGETLRICPGRGGAAFETAAGQALSIDVVFPVLHGSFGEDGTVQGLLEMLPVAYVGCNTLAASLTMDKDLTKTVLTQAAVPIVPWKCLEKEGWEKDRAAALAETVRSFVYPLFVKPANLGSSIGITKVHAEPELAPALEEAFHFDRKVLVEQGIDAREIEVSVLGNEEVRASLPGEVIPSREFYDYQAKYLDDGSRLIIPAELPSELTQRLRQTAVAAFHAVGGEGMARIDFLLDRRSGRHYLNEINAIPGFTSISMYPKMWEASGLSYADLLSELVELGRRRFVRGRQLHLRYMGKTPS